MIFDAVLGGGLIGLSATLMMFFNGRVAGISGIFGGLLSPQKGDISWRVFFVSGLIFGGLLLSFFFPSSLAQEFSLSWPIISLAGFLVGFGVKLGDGCTSGHGICGVSRFSIRSISATMMFIFTGILATWLVQHFFEGTL